MASRSQQAAKRRNAPPVKQQRPWGLIAGGVAIAIFAVAVIGYAATREEFDPRNPDISGLVSKEFEGANHRDGPIAYEETPPMGGPHNAGAQQCAVYDAAIPNEYAVHSLEHGAVWITYQPDLPGGQVEDLRKLVEGNRYRMLSPYEGLPSPVVASAWGKQLKLDSASDPRLKRFLRAFTSGPQAPEQGASCTGSSATGSLGDVPAASPQPHDGETPGATHEATPATSAAPSPSS